MKTKNLVWIILVVIIFVGILIFLKMRATGNAVESGKINFQQLTSTQRQKVIQEITSSSLLKELPEKAVISVRFFDFKNNEKIWQDEILIGKNGFVDYGIPDFYIIIHSKYISDFNNNLCEVFGRANKNGDLRFFTEQNKAKLLIKYAKVLKYKKCLSG